MDEIKRKFREAVKGKPYRPSNGTEGMIFDDEWCSRCQRDQAWRDDPDNNDRCDILSRTLIHSIDDPLYPKEWVYDNEGLPTCTAFRREGLGEPRDEAAAVGDLFSPTPPGERG